MKDLRAATAVGREDLDTVEGGLLGDTVGAATDGTGTVSTVALIVGGGGADEVRDLAGAALELLELCVRSCCPERSEKVSTYGVAGIDTSVDHVGAGSGSSSVVVAVCGRAGTGVGETSEAPRSVGLGDCGEDLGDGVLLNVLDLFDMSETLKTNKSLIDSIGDLRWGRCEESRSPPQSGWKRIRQLCRR